MDDVDRDILRQATSRFGAGRRAVPGAAGIPAEPTAVRYGHRVSGPVPMCREA